MMPAIKNYLGLIRPKHWVKNLFLFAAPFFGGRLFSEEVLPKAIPAFIAFSLCASAAYIINDIRDRDNDRQHPRKKLRPLAAGAVGPKSAGITAAVLLLLSFAAAYRLEPAFSFYVLLYIILQAMYSYYLKQVAIVDIFCIASGFLIRVFSGGAVFGIPISHWLMVTMFMISLVLAGGKRLSEAVVLNNDAAGHRKSLARYPAGALSEILMIASTASLIAYSLYTVEQFQGLIYTIPIVTFGLFRYILLSKLGKGDPTEAMIKDKWLASSVVLWLLITWIVRYGS